VPACPGCGGERFERSSIFVENTLAEPWTMREIDPPGWLGGAREALPGEGLHLAFEDDETVRVVALEEGWTRVGRSLAAHLRFDDPTVSRRHALVHHAADGVRILDDRSLNGVWVNGERTEWHELEDGDEIAIGRFRLYVLSPSGSVAGPRDGADLAPSAR